MSWSHFGTGAGKKIRKKSFTKPGEEVLMLNAKDYNEGGLDEGEEDWEGKAAKQGGGEEGEAGGRGEGEAAEPAGEGEGEAADAGERGEGYFGGEIHREKEIWESQEKHWF